MIKNSFLFLCLFLHLSGCRFFEKNVSDAFFLSNEVQCLIPLEQARTNLLTKGYAVTSYDGYFYTDYKKSTFESTTSLSGLPLEDFYRMFVVIRTKQGIRFHFKYQIFNYPHQSTRLENYHGLAFDAAHFALIKEEVCSKK